jgi:hypothetical protein
MNQTEQKAFQYLISTCGYTEDDVIFQPCRSPDFVCSDGKSFEVKKIVNRKIMFHRKQFEQFRQANCLTILVYDETQKCVTPLLKFAFSALLENSILEQGCQLYVEPKRIKYVLEKGTNKSEIWNLSFPATVDERGRLTIKKEVLDVAKIQPSDTVFLTLTGVSHKEVEA